MADACAAACSSSSSTSYSQYYDVFINHRGPDVKDTLATPLYRSLTASGLQVFLDKTEMQLGHDIPSQIEGAIQVATVHIAIFSPRYAESKWCLDELLLMVKSGKTIFPVFYGVKPEDLRWTGTDKEGPYAIALRKHEEKGRHDTQTIHEWRKALSHVANISGLELEAFNGDKDELLVKLVQSVLQKIPPQLDVGNYPTGLEGKLEELKCTVLSEKHEERPMKTKVIGIVGLGGIGKTTLAKSFFNHNRSNYKGSSFLFDVRDNKGKLHSLQRKLIKDLKHQDVEIDRVEEGKEKLTRNLSSCHALVILDDVDHVDQLHAFLVIKDVLEPNSLILVTSRDKGVLRSTNILESSIYHLKGLNRRQSQQLFCSHAFSQPDPLPGFENLVYRFIEACGGLPLSLKVLGALLCGEKDFSYWEELSEGLNKLLPADIENRLKISYDSLNEEEKQMFLDISCFCIGEDRDTWIRIWGGSGWKGLVGFRNLQSKCLVDVDSYNGIGMHDHLRDMGRHIADYSTSMARRLWQRINNLQEINDLLDQSSSSEVRGFRMARHYYLTSSRHEVCRMRKLQLLEAEGYFVESILTQVQSPKLIWLRWFNCPRSSLPSSVPMHDLRVLEVYSQKLERLWQCDSQGPVQLRELIIDAPLVEFPKSLGQLKHLERIVARKTLLAAFPEEFDLPSLKYLELRDCNFRPSFENPSMLQSTITAPLVEVPKWLGYLLKRVERIVARNTHLTTFPEEFNLPSLKYLELHGCQFQRLWRSESQGPVQLRELIIDAPLVEFPRSLGQLKYLEKIVAIQYSCLATFPEEFNLPSLKYLELRDCIFRPSVENPLMSQLAITAPILEVPKWLGYLLKRLERVVARNTHLTTFPEEFNLPSLKYLELQGCQFQQMWQYESQAPLQLKELIIDAPLVELPRSLGQLKHLEIIVAPTSLPTDFCCPPQLKYLKLKDFELKIRPDFEGELTQLLNFSLSVPMSCREMLPNFLSNLTNIRRISCISLEMVPNFLCNFTNLASIDLCGRQSLKMLPNSFGNLTNLQSINLSSCHSLKMLPNFFGNLTNLQSINLFSCHSLKMLPDSFGNLTNLQSIDLSSCDSLKMLPNSFGNLTNLQSINLSYCRSLERLPDSLGNLTNLQDVRLRWCESLKMLPNSFSKILRNILCINLSFCKSLETLPKSFGNLLQLKHLSLKGCCSLVISSETLGNLTKLECLDISCCLQMELLPPQIGRQMSLERLNLLGTNLKELPYDLESLSNLEVLRVGSPLLEELPLSLGRLTNLKKLLLYECEKLQCLPDSVELLSQLTELKIWKCGIQYLPPTVMKMKNLKVLALYGCPLRELPFKRLSLELSLSLPEGMFQLQKLQLYHTEVSNVSFPHGVCPNLQHLRIVRCEQLVEVGALPTTLKQLDLSYCCALRKIRGIDGVAELETLDLAGCHNIEIEDLRCNGTLMPTVLKSLRSPIDLFNENAPFGWDPLWEPFCGHSPPWRSPGWCPGVTDSDISFM